MTQEGEEAGEEAGERDESGEEDEFSDEEEGEIRAAKGAVYEKDEMDDEEYEKLLRQDMDEEEIGRAKEEEGKKRRDEEEEEEEDGAFDDELENHVFDEFREKNVIIQEQEKKLLDSKPWQMKGEVRAYDRPKDALLDDNLEFQHGVDLKPKSSAKISKTIETMIEQRILKEAFDDPKAVLVQQDLSWKQNFEELNFEKDQRGLASLYEDEYKRNMLGLPVETKDQKLHKEISDLFRELNNCLDNLTNSSFVPMPLAAIKKGPRGDIETINFEEKIPITVKTSDLKNAKEMLDNDKARLVAEAELNHEDNRKSRRAVKQRIRNQLKEKRKRELTKTLAYKGQSKYEYNIVNKNEKKIEHEHGNAKGDRSNLTKSSDLFKVLEESKTFRPKKVKESVETSKRAAELNKLKL